MDVKIRVPLFKQPIVDQCRLLFNQGSIQDLVCRYATCDNTCDHCVYSPSTCAITDINIAGSVVMSLYSDLTACLITEIVYVHIAITAHSLKRFHWYT